MFCQIRKKQIFQSMVINGAIIFCFFCLLPSQIHAGHNDPMHVSSIKDKKDKKEIVQIYRKALMLATQGPAHWPEAKQLLTEVFQTEYIFDKKTYNITASVLRDLLANRNHNISTSKDLSSRFFKRNFKNDIYLFINNQQDFFSYVTLPYFLVSKGHSFAIPNLSAREKTTVFYFTAPWCSFCQEYRKYLIQWAIKESDIVVREIDLVSNHSPASKDFQRLHQKANHHGIFVPVVFIYSKNRLIYSGSVKKLLLQLNLYSEKRTK